MFSKKGKEKIHRSLGIQSLDFCTSLRRTQFWNEIYDQGKRAILIKAVNLVRASLIAQSVKSLPTMQETQVQLQGWEIPLRRKWQPTPVFLPGESHGQRSLASYSP